MIYSHKTTKTGRKQLNIQKAKETMLFKFFNGDFFADSSPGWQQQKTNNTTKLIPSRQN